MDKYIEQIEAQAGLSKEEVKELVEQKTKAFKDRINIDAAASMVADDLGIHLEEPKISIPHGPGWTLILIFQDY